MAQYLADVGLHPADQPAKHLCAFLSRCTFENTCRIQVDALAGGGVLNQVDPRSLAGMAEVMKVATAGMGAQIAGPALLRKLTGSAMRLTSYKT